MVDINYFQTRSAAAKPFFIAGCDEVGRGPLAGPVVAACASLEVKNYDRKEIMKLLREWKKLGVTDSKKLNSLEREEILKKLHWFSGEKKLKINQIYSHAYSENITFKILIKEIHNDEIDQINILQASLKAMKEAMEGSCSLDLTGTVLIDGNRKFKAEYADIELETIIEGDSKSMLIAMASIAAKEYRDNLMKEYDLQYPGYGWAENAGYPTPKHRAALEVLGITPLHRKTFKSVRLAIGEAISEETVSEEGGSEGDAGDELLS